MGLYPVSEASFFQANPADGANISFNGGDRICLGQQFALTEASYTIVRLMQEFASIESRDAEQEWKEQIALVTKSRRGTKVALMKAEKDD